jgi:hypothetical protein
VKEKVQRKKVYFCIRKYKRTHVQIRAFVFSNTDYWANKRTTTSHPNSLNTKEFMTFADGNQSPHLGHAQTCGWANPANCTPQPL